MKTNAPSRPPLVLGSPELDAVVIARALLPTLPRRGGLN